MERESHYAKYSLKELLQVQQSIDWEKYPNRAAKVDAEIQRRKQNGEKVQLPDESDCENEEDSYELILDFQAEEKQVWRWAFLSTVIVVHILAVGYIWQKVSVPEISELPEYFINVKAVKCKPMGHRDSQYYDLVIKSWGANFYAVDIRKSLCQSLAKTIPKETDVKIWHLDGIIFHMMLENEVLLSEDYLRGHYRHNRLGQQEMWLAITIFFWALFFKSFVNAIRPGTFIKEE